MLLRKALAIPVLITSLLGVLAQNYNSIILVDALAVFGAVGGLFSLAVVVIGIYLIWFANDAKRNGWLS